MKYKLLKIKKVILDDAEYYVGGCVCDGCAQRVTWCKNPPITLFQAQLVGLGACLDGRMRVGAKSAREWWNTSDCAGDMSWLLSRLGAYAAYREQFSCYYDEDSDAKACDRIRAEYPFEKLQELSKAVKS